MSVGWNLLRNGGDARIRRGLAALVSIVAVVGLVAVGPDPAGARTCATPAAAGTLPIGNGLLSGRITSCGVPVRAARVTVTAWPDAAATAAAAVGSPVRERVLAATLTDERGSYALSPGLTGLAARFVDAGNGAVHLSVDVATGTANTSYDFSAAATPAATADPALADPDRNPQQVFVDLGADVVTTRLGTEPTAVAPLAVGHTSTSRSNGPAAAVGTGIDDCLYWGGWTNGAPRVGTELWEGLYNNSHAPADVDEEVGTEHETSLGSEWKGGDWGISGSVSWTKNSGRGVDLTYWHPNAIENDVDYRTQYRPCESPSDNHSILTARTSPSGMHALQAHRYGIDMAPFRTCTLLHAGAAGDSVYQDNGSNVTYAGGLILPFFTGNARAAYSKYTRITFHLQAHRSNYVCGSNGLGYADAPQISVRYTRPDRCICDGLPADRARNAAER